MPPTISSVDRPNEGPVRHPDLVAVSAPGRAPLTHGELRSEVLQVGSTLEALGLGPDQTVALVGGQSPEMAVALVALTAHAACAPLNPALRAGELDVLLADLDPSAIVVEAGLASPAREVAHARGIALLEMSPGPRAGALTLHADTRPVPRRPAPPGAALLLHTSGTTGRPKLIVSTRANLAASCRNIAAALALDESDRGLTVMPLFHIHGIMVTLAALRAGGGVVCPGAFSASGFFDALADHRPTWYSAVPTIHRAVLDELGRRARGAARGSLRLIRSSSAALAPAVAAELEEAFGVPVIEAYGMTEATHQIASNPLPPGARKPGSVGLPVGAEVAVLDEQGRRLPAGETGEIAIRGDNVAAHDADGWLRTGDLGRRDADGYVFITGRLKELINRGGEKISPREVDEALAEHPAIAQAAAFGVPHPTLGEDVAAAVVLRSGRSVRPEELRRFLAERLAAFKVPGPIHVLDELPAGSTGKVQRRALAEALGAAGRPGERTAPRTPLEARLVALATEVLRVPDVGVDDDLFERGADSLRAAQLAARIRSALSVDLPLVRVFEARTVAALAAALATDTRTHPDGGVAALVAEAGPAPLSFSQERLWFLHQLAPESPVHNRPMALTLGGTLDVAALAGALSSIVGRHEALRTTFPTVDGLPVPSVLDELEVELPARDLSSFSAGERMSRAHELAVAEARRPFDLARGPLLRALLLRLDERQHVLVVVVHHGVFDGWSHGVFVDELVAGYRSLTAGARPALPKLPVQYGDFARWQRRSQDDLAHVSALAYWREQLAGCPAVELPTDRRRPPVQTFAGARERLLLGRDLSARVRAASVREGVTAFMTLTAALQALLARYASQDDVVVGTLVAGRALSEVEGLIGCFMNLLPIRADLGGDPTGRELLARVRRAALGAFAHQDVPFEKIVEAVQPARDPSRTPIFQVVINYRGERRRAHEMAGVALGEADVEWGTVPFDLILDVTDTEDGLDCAFEYSTDLYDRRTIVRLAARFRRLVEGLIADPGHKVSSLPLLDAGERRLLVEAWNATDRRVALDRGVPEILAAWAARTPAAVAAVDDRGRLTYGELNARANRLGRALVERGIGPDRVVALLGERDNDLLLSILGVWKAAGAYLPLDPRHPAGRLAEVLGQSRAGLVIVAPAFKAAIDRALTALPDGPRPAVLTVAEALAEGHADADLPPRAGPRDLAYVIYTSGSTGVPKGAMVEHAGMLNHLHAKVEALGLTADDTVAQTASQCFDISVWQLLAGLVVGGRTRIVGDETAHDPRRLLELVAGEGVSILQVVPSLLAVTLEEPADDRLDLARLRWLIATGEALPPELCRRWLGRYPTIPLVNAYGPTECSDDVTHHVVALPPPPGAARVPIGRPILNTRIYVLDRAGEVAPVGVAGELCVGGIGVGRGYLHDPSRTAESFVPDPFGGSRLYRTGDLARYLDDATLEFLGRLDHQVKLRGHRIELDEIDATLARHPAVRSSVVVLREDVAGQPSLVGYVELAQGAVVGPAEITTFLRDRLPAYMVPAALLLLDALPLTPNGKIDRKALPVPAFDAAARSVPPRDAVETELAKIWESLLHVRPVGIRETFFELGGHSLLAARLFAEIERQSGRRLPLATLFEAPTVELLAERLRAKGWAPARSSLVAIQPRGGRRPLFCVHPHGGHVLCYRELADALGPEQPVFGLEARGLDGGEAPHASIEAMAAHYLGEMRAVQPRGPYALAGYCFGGTVAFEMARQLVAAGEEVALLALLQTYRRPALPRGRRIARDLGQRVRFEADHLRRRAAAERPGYVLGRLREAVAMGVGRAASSARERVGSWRRIPSALDAAVERVEAAAIAAARAYRPGVYPGTITLFRWSELPAPHHGDPWLGWKGLAAGGIVIHELPGHEPTLLAEPMVGDLARLLERCLRQSPAPSG